MIVIVFWAIENNLGGLVPDACRMYLYLDPLWLNLRFSLALTICES